MAPNPGAFAEVENGSQKLDIPAKVTAGSVDNYVYKLKYGRAEILGGVINQLYGGCGFSSGGMYGGLPGNSSYPATRLRRCGSGGMAAAATPYGGGGGYGYGGVGAYGGGASAAMAAGAYGRGGYP